MKSLDVIIVGAGAAGLLLGRELCNTGISMKILEEDKFVGNPYCTGLITKEGLNDLGLKLDEKIVENKIYGFKIYTKKDCLSIITKDVKGYVLNRVLFDNYLYREINTYGSIVQTGIKVIGCKRVNNGIKVLTNKDTYVTKILIGCDGVNGIVAKSFGLDHKRDIVEISKTYVKEINLDKNVAHIFVLKDISKSFFAWILYRKNRYEVAIGSRRNSREKLITFMKSLRLNPHKIYTSYIPLEMLREICFEHGFLLGNSAGQVKFSTGGGIVYSYYAARVAKKAVLKSLDLEDYSKNFFVNHYQKRFIEKYRFEINAHKFLRNIFLKASQTEFEELLKETKNQDIEKFISKYSNTDKPYRFLLEFATSRKTFKLFLKLLKLYIK